MITYTELGAAKYSLEFRNGQKKQEQRLSVAKASELSHNSTK